MHDSTFGIFVQGLFKELFFENVHCSACTVVLCLHSIHGHLLKTFHGGPTSTVIEEACLMFNLKRMGDPVVYKRSQLRAVSRVGINAMHEMKQQA